MLLLKYFPYGLHKSLFHFVVLSCLAVFNPFQSPALAHCSVHEWVTAGSERWKVYCGVDPDSARWYLGILAVIQTPFNGQSHTCLKLFRHTFFPDIPFFFSFFSFLQRREYRHTLFVLYMLSTVLLTPHTRWKWGICLYICNSCLGTWDCMGASSAKRTMCCSSSCSTS